MAQSFSLSTSQKQKLNIPLKLWLPILQTSVQDLETYFKEVAYDNLFLEVEKPKNFYHDTPQGGSSGEFIESLVFYNGSLNDTISEQICEPLFPTPSSKKVAMEILCDINENGYFDGSIEKIANTCDVGKEYVESIRQRYARLEPGGIGAKNMQESFLFQLDSIDKKIDDELYNFTKKIINDIANLDKYASSHRFNEAKGILKHFNNPPAVEYVKDKPQVIPDFFVEVDDDIEVKINNSYYPDIKVKNPFDAKNKYLKNKLKEARDLVSLLNLRKSTLYKMVLCIVEKQVSFFVGGDLKPLLMQDIANELGFAESTISRAVANKYIECRLGVFPLKHFFSNAVDKDLSSSQIKNYMKNLIHYEDKESPFTDESIANFIKEKFNLKMVRRTITKYRKLLDIPSSKERKKLYKIENIGQH